VAWCTVVVVGGVGFMCLTVVVLLVGAIAADAAFCAGAWCCGFGLLAGLGLGLGFGAAGVVAP
jgi:hypothetical protein